jgi:DNA-binding PadR family transcriptional regulator
MDSIILGLLSKKSLTVYDIKIAMDKSISNFYSNSFGSINPAIKKLEKQQLISCSESIEKSRLKKTYTITKLGTENYNHWISQPINQGRIKDEVLIRIFFMGDSSKKEQKSLLNDYLDILNDSKIELEQTKEEIERMNLSEKNRDTIKFQLLTLQFGIDYLVFKQKWFQSLLSSL